MANAAFATATEVTGLAWLRHADGSVTELHPGAVVPTPSDIITASGASVTLSINGAAPFVIGESRSVAITDDLATPVEPAQAVVRADVPESFFQLATDDPGEAAVRAEMTDSDRLLAAIESGDDPFNMLEATAAIAGGPGGDDGGGSFVRLLRIVETTPALDLPVGLPGFGATGQEDLTRLGGVPTAPAPLAVPTINLGDSTDGVHGNVLEFAGSTFNGTISVGADAGIVSVTVGGQNIANASVTPVVIATALGTLTVTGYDAATGIITYIYTETSGAQDHSAGKDAVRDIFVVTVTDAAGTSVVDNLVIQVDDTAPVANPDVADAYEDADAGAGESLTATGNVMTGGADTLGADATTVVGVVAGAATSAAGNVGIAIAGVYGSLTLNADGSYTYTLNNDSVAVQSLKDGDTEQDVFTYTIRDADGDESTTTVTITVHGKDDAPPRRCGSQWRTRSRGGSIGRYDYGYGHAYDHGSGGDRYDFGWRCVDLQQHGCGDVPGDGEYDAGCLDGDGLQPGHRGDQLQLSGNGWSAGSQRWCGFGARCVCGDGDGQGGSIDECGSGDPD